MPCLEITMPESNKEIREQLAAELTKAFAEAAGFPGQIFGIYFDEYKHTFAASGGKLCDGSEQRPYLHFKLSCPRLRRNIKQKVVKAFTDTFTTCVKQPEWKPVIHIDEHPYDNVGVAGALLSDTYDECAAQKYYYELSDD